MTPPKRPLLILLTGINGAGKSTYYKFALSELDLPFVNADVLARELWPENPDEHAYEAGARATATREAYLASGRSFISETVFSHPSKIELLQRARELGYRILLIYIHLDSPELAGMRVEERVARGGHPVPEEKLEPRYRRLFANVRKVLNLVDTAMLIDNSILDQPFVKVATIRSGVLSEAREPMPAWVRELLN